MEVLEFILNHWEAIAGIIVFVIQLIIIIYNRNWDKLKSEILKKMEELEETNLDGVAKKQVVIEFAKDLCKVLNIKFNEDKISNIIEGIIDVGNSINKRTK